MTPEQQRNIRRLERLIEKEDRQIAKLKAAIGRVKLVAKKARKLKAG